MGSGLLGGWSQANLGGFFEERPSKEIRDEIRRLLRGACGVPSRMRREGLEGLLDDLADLLIGHGRLDLRARVGAPDEAVASL